MESVLAKEELIKLFKEFKQDELRFTIVENILIVVYKTTFENVKDFKNEKLIGNQIDLYPNNILNIKISTSNRKTEFGFNIDLKNLKYLEILNKICSGNSHLELYLLSGDKELEDFSIKPILTNDISKSILKRIISNIN